MTQRNPVVIEDPVETISPSQKQRQASDPSASVWVNASAGSGKTTVLTNRVVRLLLEGVNPTTILCLTFTRAAAAEMAIRITRRLSLWATCPDDVLQLDLHDLQDEIPSTEQQTRARRLFASVLSCPGGMRIKTIHGFCQEILHRFPLEAGISPHFSVIEEADAIDLQERTLKELLHEASQNPVLPSAKALAHLAEEYGEYNFNTAMRKLLHDRARLDEALMEAGGGHQGLQNLSASLQNYLGIPAGETWDTLRTEAVDPPIFPEETVRTFAEWLSKGSPQYADRGQTILRWLALTSEQRWQSFDDYFHGFFNQDSEAFKKFANKDSLQKAPHFQAVFDSEVARLSSLQARREMHRIVQTTNAVLTFGAEFIKRYELKKKAQAVMDYDDLIVQTDQLLKRSGLAPWVLYKLDGGLNHILVDEAQDTSATQWNIVSALTEEFFAGKAARDDVNRTLFVVGDEKQSIFSFQRADPEAFAAKKLYFSRAIQQARKNYREVPMRVSFRSAPAILRAVDQVFEDKIARTGVSEDQVLHRAFHKPHEPKCGRVEVWPLIPKPPSSSQANDEWTLPLDYEAEHDQQAVLADQIADKINDLIHHHVHLHEGKRKAILAGDIMILLRRRGRLADLMVKALKERSIPVTGVDRMHLVKQISVMDLLALIQFVLLPEDDLNLATVLRNPLLNISEDQLMFLAMKRPSTLWQRLREAADNDPVFFEAHAFLAQWLGAADFMTPYSFLARVLNEPCPGSRVSGRHALWGRLGTDAIDPIEELLTAAQNFSHRHTPSLQNFLHWLMATEAEIKREYDSGAGQVRIMTIHGSKGLEAPIVFLPDTASVPAATDVPPLHWGDTTIPMYLMRKPKVESAFRQWSVARQKQMQEYRRLLYVALTRAASHLYICGWEPQRADSQEESWYSLIARTLQPLHDPSIVAADLTPRPAIAFRDPLEIVADENKMPVMATKTVALPAWAKSPAPLEDNTLRYLTPSHLTDGPGSVTPDAAYHRGTLIHRLLQSLPDLDAANQEEVASQFLANPQHQLKSFEQIEIQREVLKLLRHPDHAPLFSAQSRAEVPLVGHFDGRYISGQIDRLCVLDHEVWIVDYKTNRPPPHNIENVPTAYIRQCAAYRAVLREVYPDKTIRCFLLWTYEPRLMELPDELMPQLSSLAP